MQRLDLQPSWLRRLIPRPFYLVSTAFYLGVLFAFLIDVALGTYATCACQSSWLRIAVIVGATAVFFALDRFEYHRFGEQTPLRAALLLFIARVLIYEAVTWADAYRYSALLTIYLPLLGFWYFGGLIGLELAFLACVDYAFHQMALTPTWLSDPNNLQSHLLFLLALLFALALMQVLVQERASRTRSQSLLSELEEAHQELANAHGQLRQYANEVEQLAIAKERNRLARDIHDSLGHYLTIISVQLEKALSYRTHNPEEGDQAIRDAKRMASEALREVRQSVSALRSSDEPFALVPALQALAQRLQSERFSIAVEVEGRENGYSQQALLALYRVAQEGLTNVQKYAQATAARLHVTFGQTVATLRVTDNGQGFDVSQLDELSPGREGGYGIQGTRERLELLGGALQVHSEVGAGVTLIATIPSAVQMGGTPAAPSARGHREVGDESPTSARNGARPDR
jgi:signal transduction histidine kinase